MRVVVTGSSGDIGSVIAEKFAQEGFTVYGLDLKDGKVSHPLYNHYCVDVRKKEDFPEFMEVNIIVNCAGVYKAEDFIGVNYYGAVNTVNAYYDPIHTKSIVNIASSFVKSGSGVRDYVCSKSALITYTKWLAQQYGPFGLVANSISPGGVVTEGNSDILLNEDNYNLVKEQNLLNKWVWTPEIAEWVYFLATVNKSMTGQDLVIDNGESLKLNFI